MNRLAILCILAPLAAPNARADTSALYSCSMELGGKGRNIFSSISTGEALRKDSRWEPVTLLRLPGHGVFVITAKQTSYFDATLSDCIAPEGFETFVVGAVVPWPGQSWKGSAGAGWDKIEPEKEVGHCPKNEIAQSRIFDNSKRDSSLLDALRAATDWNHVSHPQNPADIPNGKISDAERTQLSTSYNGIKSIYDSVLGKCRGVLDGSAFATTANPPQYTATPAGN